MTTLDQLDALAGSATPGPWQAIGYALSAGRHRLGDTRDHCCFGHSGRECSDESMADSADADAAYIAAADPATVQALVAVVRAAQDLIDNRSPIDTDGETLDTWCHFCDNFRETHEPWCLWDLLAASLQPLTEPTA